MPRYLVKFDPPRLGPGLALEVEAADREAAWDAYKQRTGRRRRPDDPAPTVIEIPTVLIGEASNGPDSG